MDSLPVPVLMHEAEYTTRTLDSRPSDAWPRSLKRLAPVVLVHALVERDTKGRDESEIYPWGDGDVVLFVSSGTSRKLYTRHYIVCQPYPVHSTIAPSILFSSDYHLKVVTCEVAITYRLFV